MTDNTQATNTEDQGSERELNDLQSDTRGEMGSDVGQDVPFSMENQDPPPGDEVGESDLGDEFELNLEEGLGALENVAAQYFQYNGESISELLSGIRESIDAQCQCILKLTNVIEGAVSQLTQANSTIVKPMPPKNRKK